MVSEYKKIEDDDETPGGDETYQSERQTYNFSDFDAYIDKNKNQQLRKSKQEENPVHVPKQDQNLQTEIIVAKEIGIQVEDERIKSL